MSLEEKLKCKTIKIRAVGDIDLEKKQFTVDLNKLVHSGSTGASRGWYSKALFELAHPKVKVEGISFNLWPRDAKTIMAAVAGGTAPSMYPIWLAGGPQVWINKGMAADITNLIKEWNQTDYLKKNGWAVWKYGWKDGRCYGVPWGGVNNQMIFFRKDWFKEAGLFNEKGEPKPSDNWNWNDFQNIAVKLTDVKKKRWGFVYSPTDISRVDQPFFRIAGSFGVFEPFCFCTPDKSGKYTWQVILTPQLKKALQFFRYLRFKHNCMLTGIEITFHGAYDTELIGGRAGMACIWIQKYVARSVTGPYSLSPTIPYTEIIGGAVLPRGPYNVQWPARSLTGYAFDPTLSKEELKAAFLWYDWTYRGRGREIMLEQAVDQATATGWKTLWRNGMEQSDLVISGSIMVK